MWLFLNFILLVTLSVTSCSARDSSEDGIRLGTKKANCTCGWANRSGKRILGGKEAEENEFPMVAGLIKRDLFIPGVGDIENVQFCGGTIITHRHVVTAGHCMHDQNGNRFHPTDLGVVVGVHNIKELNYYDPNVLRSPEELILHPKYKWHNYYDLAIVVLPYIEFTDLIGPACLPTERFVAASKVLKVIGWGFITPQGPSSDVLKKTNIVGLSHKQCSLIWGEAPQFQIEDPYQICTFQPGSSQCLGDSGGPILWTDPETNRYTLVGAPSFGVSSCLTSPSVSSDISYYVPWIQQVISETYPEEKTCAKID